MEIIPHVQRLERHQFDCTVKGLLVKGKTVLSNERVETEQASVLVGKEPLENWKERTAEP